MFDKKNVPEIRFKGFDGEWEETKIGKISDSYSGGTPSVGIKEYYNGEIPFMRSGEINSNSTELTLTESGLKNSSAKFVNTGDILYALYGATSGEVSRANLKCTINQAILAILPHNGYDSEFLRHWLRKQKQVIISTYLQGGQGNLSGSIVKELNLDIPTLPEQTQIGTYFQNLDSLISLHQRKYDKLLTVKKAMLEKMFPKEGADVPEIRFKGFVGKWEKKKLGDVAKLGSSKRVHREDYVESGIPFFRGLEISKLGSSLLLDDVLFISENNYNELKEKYGVPQIGDILITAVGTLGNSYLVSNNTPFYFKDGNLIWLREININPDYLNLYIGEGIGKKRVLESAAGSNQKALTMVKLQNVQVFLPLDIEQKKIANFFQNLDTLITQHQKELEKLKNLKKACLEKMFV